MNDDEAAMREHLRALLVGARKELGVTVKQLSQETGISRSNIHAMENRGQKTRLSTYQRYARGLGMQIRMEIVSDETTT